MRTLRAVSPVVATALLVLIAVATAVILYLWVSGTVANQPTQQQTLNEEIKIDAVKYDAANNELVVYVRNVGSALANITTAYVINVTTGSVIAENTSANVVLKPGDVGEVYIGNVALHAGDSVIIKVVTKDGVEAQYLYAYKG